LETDAVGFFYKLNTLHNAKMIASKHYTRAGQIMTHKCVWLINISCVLVLLNMYHLMAWWNCGWTLATWTYNP